MEENGFIKFGQRSFANPHQAFCFYVDKGVWREGHTFFYDAAKWPERKTQHGEITASELQLYYNLFRGEKSNGIKSKPEETNSRYELTKNYIFTRGKHKVKEVPQGTTDDELIKKGFVVVNENQEGNDLNEDYKYFRRLCRSGVFCIYVDNRSKTKRNVIWAKKTDINDFLLARKMKREGRLVPVSYIGGKRMLDKLKIIQFGALKYVSKKDLEHVKKTNKGMKPQKNTVDLAGEQKYVTDKNIMIDVVNSLSEHINQTRRAVFAEIDRVENRVIKIIREHYSPLLFADIRETMKRVGKIEKNIAELNKLVGALLAGWRGDQADNSGESTNQCPEEGEATP